MTKVKICGLKRIEDIEAVNELCPDYIGFVFASFSHRYVDKETARKLKEALRPEIQAVGVFVNEEVNFVAELLNDGIIDIAQLHGSEDDEYIAELRGKIRKGDDKINIIKMFNIDEVSDYRIINESPADMVLIDSGMGSGETFDWSKLEGISRPYFLAGGLDPDNVLMAIDKLHPYGVDVSSGVETEKHKDEGKMHRFIEIVRKCDSKV